MFHDRFLEQYYDLGRAIELNQVDKITATAGGLYAEPNTAIRKNGDSALHVAAENGNLEIFLLIWKQITTSPVAKNHNGELPYHYACKEGALNIVTLYVQEIKASVDTKTADGWTGLFYATFNNQIPVTQYLVSKKANINLLDKYVRSPLHWAAKFGFVEILKRLVGAGGDIDAKDREGKSVRHIMTSWEDPDLVEKVEGILELTKKFDKKKEKNAAIKPGVAAARRGK